MIIQIHSLSEYQEFIESFIDDKDFSDPHFMYDNNNLYSAFHKKNQSVWVIKDADIVKGLFVILDIEEEKYAELMIVLSRNQGAYEELEHFLIANYIGYTIDFVMNPKNALLRQLLEKNHADFEAEQVRMRLNKMKSINPEHNIQLYSEGYKEQYLALHQKDTYWTGEKVLEATDRFRVFLAFDKDEVVGYIDVTYCYEENEPYDIMVDKEHVHQGYERDLLAEAVKQNVPKTMMVLLDADDKDMTAVFTEVGFEKVENQNSITAHWRN